MQKCKKNTVPVGSRCAINLVRLKSQFIICHVYVAYRPPKILIETLYQVFEPPKIGPAYLPCGRRYVDAHDVVDECVT